MIYERHVERDRPGAHVQLCTARGTHCTPLNLYGNVGLRINEVSLLHVAITELTMFIQDAPSIWYASWLKGYM